MEDMSDSLRINISVPFLEQNNFEKGMSFRIKIMIITINKINIYFKMKRVSDQTSNIASAIGATYILVFLNMEVATHKRNDKIYINLSLHCNYFKRKI